VNEAPLPPSQVNPDVPPRLDAVVMKALAKNPANRYQTAQEMVEDLERVRQGQEVQATPLLAAGAGDATQVIARPQATQVLPPSEEPPGSGRKVWLGVLIGILVVLLLAGAGYLLAQAFQGEDTPDAFTLDDYTGMLYPDAKRQLEELELVVIKEAKPSDKPEDTVLKQSPEPGALVLPGDEITLTVATARTTGVVPDLTGLTTSEASLLLAEESLTLGTQTPVPSDDFDPGQIVSQSIAPETEVPVATVIDVNVASGPSTVTVPDVTCQPYGAAKAELKNIGLVATLGGTAPVLPQCTNKNLVAAQDPTAFTDVAVGSTVTLYTGEEEPSPTPTDSPSPTP
ncbi:MAG TPA: PASTA domain-containing protein, partial [Actinomycetota bacterium]